MLARAGACGGIDRRRNFKSNAVGLVNFLFLTHNKSFVSISILGWDLSSVGDIECIGVTSGIVGEIKLPGVYDPHLLIIREASAIGSLEQNHLV